MYTVQIEHFAEIPSNEIALGSVGPLALGVLIPGNTLKLWNSVVIILLMDQNSATAVIKCGQKVPDISQTTSFMTCVTVKVFGSSFAIFLGSEEGAAEQMFIIKKRHFSPSPIRATYADSVVNLALRQDSCQMDRSKQTRYHLRYGQLCHMLKYLCPATHFQFTLSD